MPPQTPAATAPPPPPTPLTSPTGARIYTVKTPEGHEVTFRWDHPEDPNDTDLEQIAKEANLSIIKRPPPFSGPPPTFGGFLEGLSELGGMIAGPELVGPLKLGEGFGPAVIQAGKKMLLAGVGAATGQSAGRIAEGQPPPSFPELARTAEQGAVGEATGQMIKPALEVGKAVIGATTGPIGNIARRVVGRIAGPPTVEGAEAAAVVGPHNITAAQLRNAPTLSAVEKFARGAIFSGGARSTALRGQAALERAAQQVVEGFGPAATPEEAGRLLQRTTEAAHAAARADASALYDRVDQLAQGKTVSLHPVIDFAQTEAERRGQLGMALQGGRAVSTLKKIQQAAVPSTGSAAEEAAQWLANPDRGGTETAALKQAFLDAGIDVDQVASQQVSFSQAHHIRSALGKLTRNSDPQVRGVAKQLYSRMNQAMTDAAGGADSPLGQAYAEATTGWKTMTDTYQRGLMSEVVKKKPEAVVNTVIKPGRVEAITKARETVGPEAWRGVQYAQAEKILNSPTGDLVSGEELTKRLTRMRKETLQAVYPAGQDNGFWQLGRVMQQLTHGEPPKYLQMRIQIGQGIALLGVGTAMVSGRLSPEHAIGAGSIILSPALIGRILINPPARKMLMEGLQATAGKDPGRAARLAGQLSSWLMMQNLVPTPQTAGPPQPSIR